MFEPTLRVSEFVTFVFIGLTSNFPYLLRMMAADTMQSEALVDLVETMGWTRMAILTSNTDYGKVSNKVTLKDFFKSFLNTFYR